MHTVLNQFFILFVDFECYCVFIAKILTCNDILRVIKVRALSSSVQKIISTVHCDNVLHCNMYFIIKILIPVTNTIEHFKPKYLCLFCILIPHLPLPFCFITLNFKLKTWVEEGKISIGVHLCESKMLQNSFITTHYPLLTFFILCIFLVMKNERVSFNWTRTTMLSHVRHKWATDNEYNK